MLAGHRLACPDPLVGACVVGRAAKADVLHPHKIRSGVARIRGGEAELAQTLTGASCGRTLGSCAPQKLEAQAAKGARARRGWTYETTGVMTKNSFSRQRAEGHHIASAGAIRR
jgi:hypothetical protein